MHKWLNQNQNAWFFFRMGLSHHGMGRSWGQEGSSKPCPSSLTSKRICEERAVCSVRNSSYHAPHNLFSLSGLVLKWVYRRNKEQNLSLKYSLFQCCSFLCCCFKVWAFPAPIHPHSPLLFLVKVYIGTRLLDRKMETFYHMPLLNTTKNTLDIFHSTQAA